MPKKPVRGIRDARLRALARTAADQDFEFGRLRSHRYLKCPQCHERITFSSTVSEADPHAFRKILGRLRKHGLRTDGTGGEHTARPAHTRR